jgi:hypothetical protein
MSFESPAVWDKIRDKQFIEQDLSEAIMVSAGGRGVNTFQDSKGR